MKNLELISNPQVDNVFANYPEHIRTKLLDLRELILHTAEELEDVSKIEETLKWGEPSYLTKNGSTLRIDWKSKKPDQYAMYFKCTSRLVETFRSIFKTTFKYEGNRAIVFNLDDEIPVQELKECIKATLIYHKVKHLPTLSI